MVSFAFVTGPRGKVMAGSGWACASKSGWNFGRSSGAVLVGKRGFNAKAQRRGDAKTRAGKRGHGRNMDGHGRAGSGTTPVGVGNYFAVVTWSDSRWRRGIEYSCWQSWIWLQGTMPEVLPQGLQSVVKAPLFLPLSCQSLPATADSCVPNSTNPPFPLSRFSPSTFSKFPVDDCPSGARFSMRLGPFSPGANGSCHQEARPPKLIWRRSIL